VNIPNRIKELIKIHKIASVNELGRIANIPQSTLATLMLGKTSPRTDTLEQICNGLGITLADFFTPSTNIDPILKTELLPEDLKLARELKDLPDKDRKEVESYIQYKKNANKIDELAATAEK